MKMRIHVLVLFALATGCSSMNVRDRDLACTVNDLIQARCVSGEEKRAEVCEVSRLLQARCSMSEGKAKLFARLREASTSQ